jgi:hypothetical protein
MLASEVGRGVERRHRTERTRFRRPVKTGRVVRDVSADSLSLRLAG